MLIEIDKNKFKDHFYNDPHPFISIPFIELNKSKVDKIVYLVESNSKRKGIGLVAGIKNNKLISPFSAPFGGFHFKNDNIYIREIEQFIELIKLYLKQDKLSEFNITLPPDFYHQSINAKIINSMIRCGFSMKIPEITNYVDLKKFHGIFTDRTSRNYLNQAIRNELSFKLSNNLVDKKKVYDLIAENRKKFNRPIYMSFEDVLNTNNLLQTDFFQVNDNNNNIVASAIFYRLNEKISYAVFWGDNSIGRPLRSMDFISFNLWNYYKELGVEIIDLGTSTESGIPNEGLLRFKETHNCTSQLRYSFFWSISN